MIGSVSVVCQDGQTFIIMPGFGSDNSIAPAADDSQARDVPSSNENEQSPVAVATSSEAAANHEARQLQDNSDDVNLSDVDHTQTVVTAQQPTTSGGIYDFPGLCPICGDKISGSIILTAGSLFSTFCLLRGTA